MREGNTYTLFTFNVNGIDYYFIGYKGRKGFLLCFSDNEKAVDQFEFLERRTEQK